jgi:Family of unknown function (DUF6152)
MKMKNLTIFAGFLIAVCFASTLSYGHHSAAGIDRTKTVTVEGTVKQFKWANPHSWLEIEVQNSKGGEIWNFEMNPPAFLVRSGWKSSSVKIGDKVKVTARPFINGDTGGIFMSLTLPDGTTLGAGAQPSPTSAAQPPAK